jgi:large subunit ribosomal protein L29
MNGSEVRGLSSEEITVELGKLREKLYNLRVQKATEKVEDTSLFSKIRKDVARLRTEQMRRHREAASA